MKLNGAGKEEVKKTLVHSFGNSIGFMGSEESTLVVTSSQESVIEKLKIIAGLTIIRE